MAGPAPAATVQQPPTTRYGPALALLATLFFMWGFISVINGTLLPHLRSVFKLSYFQTGLIESVWFIGYLLASLPAAKLIERIGYQRALTMGLLVMTAGSLGMILAAYLISYTVTVVSLFTVSCGIALLQVAANPYVAVIGPADSSNLDLPWFRRSIRPGTCSLSFSANISFSHAPPPVPSRRELSSPKRRGWPMHMPLSCHT